MSAPERLSTPSRARVWSEMLGIVFEADRGRATVVFATYVAAQILTALSALAIRFVIDGAVVGVEDQMIAGAALFGGSIAAGLFLTNAMTAMRVTLIEKANLLVEAKLMKSLGGIPGIEHFESQEFADEIELLRLERAILGGAADHVLLGLGMVVSLSTSALLLVSLHPVFVLLPLLALPSLWASTRQERWRQDALAQSAARSRLALELLDLLVSPRAGNELRIYGLGDEILTRRDVLLREIDAIVTRAGFTGALLNVVAWGAYGGGFALALWAVITRVGSGVFTPGDLFMLITIATRVNVQVVAAGRLVSGVARVFNSVARYLRIDDYASSAAAGDEAKAPAPEELREGLVVDGVSFAYPGAGSLVLRGIDLRIPPGSVVAVVGGNGAGKTTLVKLLCGLYEPTSGAIRVDGRPLSTVASDGWRAQLSATFQDFARFELRAREAVGVGDVDNIENADAVERALADGSALDVVETLPDGLDTRLASVYLDGYSLSEGQWQKVALARAMMRRPLLLVLDEPSSSLDARTERELLDRLAVAGDVSARRGNIALVVSHRLASVRKADLIVVMEHGTIVEQGSHGDLIELGGRYARMFDMQAVGYR